MLVQPSTYGTDNRWHLEALRDLGPERTRMVAVVNTEVTDEELRRMHGLGVRGIRFNLSPPGTTTLDMVEPLSRRVHALGWHCQFHMPPGALVEAGPVLERLPSRVVIDHLGRERWPGKFGQADKWKVCLRAARMPRIRSDNGEASTPDAQSGLQGEGGVGRHQGREDAGRAGAAV